jgi:hypothetical protein
MACIADKVSNRITQHLLITSTAVTAPFLLSTMIALGNETERTVSIGNHTPHLKTPKS